MREETGQASVEWIGLVLLVALVLGGALAGGVRIDGRSFGGFLAHRFACAVEAACRRGDGTAPGPGRTRQAGARKRPNMAYEPREAELPVDFRRCRARRCADATLDRDSDVHRSRSGEHRTSLFPPLSPFSEYPWLAGQVATVAFTAYLPGGSKRP